MNQTGTATCTPVQRTLAWSAAVAAAAGGLIHFRASVDHRHLAAAAIGFAAMGACQWLFAGTMLVRPSRITLAFGAALHAGILLTWVLSRTIGLPFIPGAEQPAPVGVADLVANTFSIAVAATAVVALAIARIHTIAGLRPRVVNTIRAVVLTGVLILTVAALAETHDHDHHEAVATQPATGHDSNLSTPTMHSHDEHHHHPGSSSGRPQDAVQLSNG